MKNPPEQDQEKPASYTTLQEQTNIDRVIGRISITVITISAIALAAVVALAGLGCWKLIELLWRR